MEKGRKQSREIKEIDCPVTGKIVDNKKVGEDCKSKEAIVLVEFDGKNEITYKLQCTSCKNVFERTFKKPKQDSKSGKIIAS